MVDKNQSNDERPSLTAIAHVARGLAFAQATKANLASRLAADATHCWTVKMETETRENQEECKSSSLVN